MSFRELELKTSYETGVDDLIEDFYVPVLSRARRYDRIAGFFTSVSLAMVAEGLIEFVENDGHIRLLVNTHLDEQDEKVLRGELDTPTETLREIFDSSNADDDVKKVRWKVLAWLLDNDRLEIKICTVTENRTGIFHPKLGILYDDDDNIVTFEGSNNETLGGLTENFDRFKVAASWKDGQEQYIPGDTASFDAIWEGTHPSVRTYELPEAFEADIIENLPNDKQQLIEEADEVLPERIKTVTRPGKDDRPVEVLNYAGNAIGGTHIAETSSTVTPWPHQRIVADTLYSTYPKGFLLCDEVGLGKTIEAGLTLSRLIQTEEIQSGLILAPANLTTQWQEELWEKFNLNTYRYDRSGGRYVFNDALGQEHSIPNLDVDDNYAWAESPIWRFVHEKNSNGEPAIIIASWHLARMEQHQNTFVPRQHGQVRTVDDVQSSCRGRPKDNREGVWDLTIVDEAHKARRRDFTNVREQVKGTPNNLLSLLRDLGNHAHSIYLLTATPMQIHPVELYDLLSLAGLPEEWDDPRDFLGFFETRLTLGEVLHSPEHTGQTTVNNGGIQKQQTLASSDDILTKFATELGIERTVARRRILNACELVRSYDEAHDGVYPDNLIQAIESSKERRHLHDLLYREDAYVGISSEWKREQAIDNLAVDGWELVLRAFEEATPVDIHLHRNTRDVLREYERAGLLGEGNQVPRREVRPIELDLGEASEVYEHIEDYVQQFHRRAMEADEEHVKATGFVMTVYRQRMTSSFHAIKKSLESRLDKLRSTRDILDDIVDGHGVIDDEILPDSELFDLDLSVDEATEVFEDLSELDEVVGLDPENLNRSHQLIEEEIGAIEAFIDDVQDLIATQDPKLAQLRDDIRDINKEGRDRVMIFTQYGDTLEVIRESLVPTFGRQVGCYSGRGGEMYIEGEWKKVGKERVKQEFSGDDGDVEILVCTESASHGLNLQKCGVVINYDLPWNPMRVEQRIGRIDRIGQQYDPIWIYNYYYGDTVEMDAYDVLQDRVGMFEDYVGGMQPIFANVEGAIQRAAMEGTAVELDEGEEDESHDYIRSIMDYETVEEAQLNGWNNIQHPDIGDIHAGSSYPNELGISPEYIEEQLLQQELDGIEIEQVDVDEISDGQVYALTIHDLENWVSIRESIAPPGPDTIAEELSSITETKATIPVTFSPDVADEYQSIRYLAFGDPIFERLVSAQSDSGTSTEFIALNRDGTVPAAVDDPWVVCGWMSGSDSAEIGYVGDERMLQDWLDQKLQLESLLRT